MLNKTATLKAEPNSPENNAYIESFVIHARILIEFLYGYPIEKDTIYAADYVDHWWDNYIGDGKPLEKTDLLRDVGKNANKLAAHLTLVGSENEVYNWDRVKIRDEINKKISDFLKNVPETTISKEIKEIIENVMTAPGPSGSSHELEVSCIGATGPTGPHGGTKASRRGRGPQAPVPAGGPDRMADGEAQSNPQRL
jgi:hypothetical protein